MGLELIRTRAQGIANADDRQVAILNLNRIGAPMYVIREATDGIEAAREFVEIVKPVRQ